MADGKRVAAFEKKIGPIAGGFYSRERMPDSYDFRILLQLKTYPERRAGNLAVSHEFRSLFAPARRKFEAVFGPVSSPEPVYLLDSMGELDGGTRDLQGRSTLLFGVDVIAQVHAGKDMTAFFEHELFHVYHEKQVTSCGLLWCALWEEGLATYVASRLNPHADDDALSLNLPEPIRPAVEANRAARSAPWSRGSIPTTTRISPTSSSPILTYQASLRGWPITSAISSRRTSAEGTICTEWQR